MKSLSFISAIILTVACAEFAHTQVMDPLTVAQVASANNTRTTETTFANNPNSSLFPLWTQRALSAGITSTCANTRGLVTTYVDNAGVLRFSATDARGVGAVTWSVSTPPSGIVGPLAVRISKVTSSKGSTLKPTILVTLIGASGFARERFILPPQTNGPLELKIIPSQLGRRGAVALKSLKTIELKMDTNGGCATTVEIDRITFGRSTNPGENVGLIGHIESGDIQQDNSVRARYSQKFFSERRDSRDSESPSQYLGMVPLYTRTPTPKPTVTPEGDPCDAVRQSDAFKKFDQECRSTPQACRSNCRGDIGVGDLTCDFWCVCDPAPKNTACNPGEGADCAGIPHFCDGAGSCVPQTTQDWSAQCVYGDPRGALCLGRSDLGGFEPAGTTCKLPPNTPGLCDGYGHCLVAPAPGNCQGIADCTPCAHGKFCFKNACLTEAEAAKLVCESEGPSNGGKGLCAPCEVFFESPPKCVVGVISVPGGGGLDMTGSPCERKVNGTWCSGTCRNGGCAVSCPVPTPTPTPRTPATPVPSPYPSR